jgi:hypothetical protein
VIRPCSVCAVAAYRAELYVCPICGQPGTKGELDALAHEWWAEMRDRETDQEATGTPAPKMVIQ